jgi:hypothetical protein
MEFPPKSLKNGNSPKNPEKWKISPKNSEK